MSTIVSGSALRNASPSAASGELLESQTISLSNSATSSPPAESEGASYRDELLREVHWTRPDGSFCFAPRGESRREIERRRARLTDAVREFGDAELAKIARTAQDRRGKPAEKSKGMPKPAPSFHHEALRATVLRSDWSAKAVQLAVDWSRPALQLELAVGRDVVVSGIVPPHVVVDGHARPAIGSWEEVCFLADEEGDYLELELALGGGLRLQRHFALLRRDGLLWIADAVLNSAAADLQCELSLPFAPQTQFTSAPDTADMLAAIGRRKYAILPPALPEWRDDRRGGELSVAEGTVRLHRSAHQATAVYAPLCIVVDPRRAKGECTWRRLTVGEDQQIQPADRAVGYRIQLGREQWLVYRSLTPRANRTVLGVNLQTNFLCARFGRDGAAEALIEIED